MLELDGVFTIGCNVAGDLNRLWQRFGIKFKRIRDNRRYCLIDNRSQKTGLQDLAAAYLGFHVDKSSQQANFNVKPPLDMRLQKYAFIDARLPLKINDAITSKLDGIGSINSARYPPNLRPGTLVTIKNRWLVGSKCRNSILGQAWQRCW